MVKMAIYNKKREQKWLKINNRVVVVVVVVVVVCVGVGVGVGVWVWVRACMRVCVGVGVGGWNKDVLGGKKSKN